MTDGTATPREPSEPTPVLPEDYTAPTTLESPRPRKSRRERLRTVGRAITITVAVLAAVIATLTALLGYPGSYNQMLKAEAHENAVRHARYMKPRLSADERTTVARTLESVCDTLDTVRLNEVDAEKAGPEVGDNLRTIIPAATSPKRARRQAITLVNQVCAHNLDTIVDVFPYTT